MNTHVYLGIDLTKGDSKVNDQVSGTVDLRMRRLLADPTPIRIRTSARFNAEAIRAVVSVADAVQVIALGLALRPLLPTAADAVTVWQACGLAALAAALAVAARRSLRPSGPEPPALLAGPAAVATFLALVAVASISWITLSQSTTPSPSGRTVWFLVWAVTAACGSAGVRYAAAWATARLESGRRIVVVGSPEHAEPFARSVETAPPGSWRLMGRFDDREPGALDELVDTIARLRVDVVALALNGSDAAERLATVGRRLADQPIRVCLALDPVALAAVPRSATRLASVPLVDILTDPHGGRSGAMKRCIDFAISLLALIAFAPVMLAVAAAIRLESPGPVIFPQWRFGLGSLPIAVLKFRTMYAGAGDKTGETRTLARDSRVTRVGRILRRTSLDELPQLINVLRGDMSLVGPRPHPLHMRIGEHYYFEAVTQYRNRHLVKPGITGWAQVNGSRGQVDTLEKAERRVELDLWYLEHWSLWLDLRILLITALGGFLSIGAD
jgi:polysaccharide biosynthesis protein PslA